MGFTVWGSDAAGQLDHVLRNWTGAGLSNWRPEPDESAV